MSDDASSSVARRVAHWLPTTRPQAITFDVGLTLIHPSGRVLVEELEKCDVPQDVVSPDQAVLALAMAAEAGHLQLPYRLSRAEKVAVTWATLLGVEREAAVAGFMSAIARRDLYVDLDPGALETICSLRRLGIALGAVSNSEGTLREDLAEFGLLEYFDVVVDSSVVGVEKPAPGIFKLALDDLSPSDTDCWHVGDGLVNDVLGAQGAGFGASILFDPFRCFEHLATVPRISQLSELIGLVAD